MTRAFYLDSPLKINFLQILFFNLIRNKIGIEAIHTENQQKTNKTKLKNHYESKHNEYDESDAIHSTCNG